MSTEHHEQRDSLLETVQVSQVSPTITSATVYSQPMSTNTLSIAFPATFDAFGDMQQAPPPIMQMPTGPYQPSSSYM